MMKKRIMLLALAALALLCLCACGKNDESRKLKIVTTVFPAYDWVKEILGDNPGEAEVTLLANSGVDMHSFQPTAEDILKISTADVFIYVGGESDAWVKDALKNVTNKSQVTINLLQILGTAAKTEETVEGMEDTEEDAGYDEHIWLSPKNARTLVSEIAKVFSLLDEENKPAYSHNTFYYQLRLATLQGDYEALGERAAGGTVLFADRFPFRYLMDDCGIKYYAAFSGCSAETEASFKTIAFLAGKVDELGLPAVLIIDGSDRRLAETIIENTRSKDQKILTLNSMQSVTAADIANGAHYTDIMAENYMVLKEALGLE